MTFVQLTICSIQICVDRYLFSLIIVQLGRWWILFCSIYFLFKQFWGIYYWPMDFCSRDMEPKFGGNTIFCFNCRQQEWTASNIVNYIYGRSFYLFICLLCCSLMNEALYIIRGLHRLSSSTILSRRRGRPWKRPRSSCSGSPKMREKKKQSFHLGGAHYPDESFRREPLLTVHWVLLNSQVDAFLS